MHLFNIQLFVAILCKLNLKFINVCNVFWQRIFPKSSKLQLEWFNHQQNNESRIKSKEKYSYFCWIFYEITKFILLSLSLIFWDHEMLFHFFTFCFLLLILLTRKFYFFLFLCLKKKKKKKNKWWWKKKFQIYWKK